MNKKVKVFFKGGGSLSGFTFINFVLSTASVAANLSKFKGEERKNLRGSKFGICV